MPHPSWSVRDGWGGLTSAKQQACLHIFFDERPHGLVREPQLRFNLPHRTGASRRQSLRLALTVGSECEARADVLFRQIWKIAQYLRVRHSRRQVSEHIPHSHAQSANARLAAPLARLHRDDLRIVHKRRLSHRPTPAKENGREARTVARSRVVILAQPESPYWPLPLSVLRRCLFLLSS